MIHLGNIDASPDGHYIIKRALCGREGSRLQMIPMTSTGDWVQLRDPQQTVKTCKQCQTAWEKE